MFSVFLFISGSIMVLVMSFMALFIGKEKQMSSSALTPLESGLATTSKIYTMFSVQVLMVLILLLIFDLEVVFIISFVLGGSLSTIKSLVFMGFITVTLWLEWVWGKLLWVM